jgi:hypothetical protein
VRATAFARVRRPSHAVDGLKNQTKFDFEAVEGMRRIDCIDCIDSPSAVNQ